TVNLCPWSLILSPDSLADNFIFNELDIQCKGQKEMLVKINIKDVFLGGYVEQTRKHYEMVFEVVGIDDSGCCHVQVRATFSILLMDLLVSRKYRKEISGFILIVGLLCHFPPHVVVKRAILLKGNCLQMGLGCRDADSDIG
ncbi:hypothetical protein NC653_003066, partial [Populus alba x Populus x berolinensis]